MADWYIRAIERGVSFPQNSIDGWLLAEDESGALCVPRGHWEWRGRYNPRNPAHWPFWLHTRLRRRIVMVANGDD